MSNQTDNIQKYGAKRSNPKSIQDHQDTSCEVKQPHTNISASTIRLNCHREQDKT